MSYWFHPLMRENSSHTGYKATILPLRDALYAMALRLTRNPDAAEDLVQDAMVKAFRSWHTFTPGTNAKAWLFTIARHTFYSQQKAHVRRSQIHANAAHEPELLVGAVPSPEALEGAQRVREAISRLPEVYRDAIRLADLDGYSYQETADALGCPIGSVMSRLYRGRRKLAELLKAA